MAGTVWALFWEGGLTGEIRAALLGKLSPADRAQYGTFPSGGRAGARGRQFLLSRALLAFALEETLGTVPALAKTAEGLAPEPTRRHLLPARSGNAFSRCGRLRVRADAPACGHPQRP